MKQGRLSNSRHARLDDSSILIVGGDSSIGQSLKHALEGGGQRVLETTRHTLKVSATKLFLDLSQDERNWTLPPIPAKTAVICAAITSLEKCQTIAESSRLVNVANTVALAKRLLDSGTFVIFLSSNAVFDGETPFAKSSSPVNSQTEYGRQKSETEKKLLALDDRVAIVRLSKVITPNMPLFLGWIRQLRQGKVIHPILNMVMSPVWVGCVVEVLKMLSDKQLSMLVHFSANQDITYYETASYLAIKLGLDQDLISPISSADKGIHAPPKFTTLDCSEMEGLGYDAPTPLEALDRFLEHCRP